MSDQLIIPNVHRMTKRELDKWNRRWPDFSPSELSSWNGELSIYEPALDALQELRTRWGKPMVINSAYRNFEHNKAVGGAMPRKGSVGSQHLYGKAFDIHIRNKTERRAIEELARELGFRGIGRYNTFLHIDTRDGRAATWGVAW